MILCDTNILIEVYRGNSRIIETLKKIGQENICISDVTCAELLYGARNKNELQTIKNDFKKLTVLSIQSEISKMAVDLVAKYALSHKLSLPDALIAATAIKHQLELFSLNNKDFRYLEDIRLFVIE